MLSGNSATSTRGSGSRLKVIRTIVSTAKPIAKYDGLKEHFTDLDEIDASNYGLYMKPEDVERQKVLESYGYRFLRLNRFNLGNDPVRTLDERLARMGCEGTDRCERPELHRGLYHDNSVEHALRAKTRRALCRCDGILPLGGRFGLEDPQCWMGR
jgi:hypothetical protein